MHGKRSTPAWAGARPGRTGDLRLHDRIALDMALPPEYRGRDGAEALVRNIPLRVSVMGISGTFELTRMVHQALAARRHRVFAKAGLTPVDGSDGSAWRRRLQEGRLLWQAKRSWPTDAFVLENRELGAAGLHVNTKLCQAQAILLTHLSRDARDGGRGVSAQRVADFAATLPPRTSVISGEADPATRKALRDAVVEAGAFYIDAAPPPSPDAMPGLESVAVLDRFLRIRTGGGLSTAERTRLLAGLQRGLQWSPSAFEGVRFHDGTHLEPVRLRVVLDHLVRRWPARVHVVAYFEASRTAEAARMVPVLRKAFEDGLLAHAYVAGAGSRPITRDLASSMPVTVFGRKPSSVPGLVRILRQECRSGALVTVGDAGSAWMRALSAKVRVPGLPRGAWAPYGAEASALPAAIAPARPPARAPGKGIRSKAHVLGDVDPALVQRRQPSSTLWPPMQSPLLTPRPKPMQVVLRQ